MRYTSRHKFHVPTALARVATALVSEKDTYFRKDLEKYVIICKQTDYKNGSKTCAIFVHDKQDAPDYPYDYVNSLESFYFNTAYDANRKYLELLQKYREQ